MAPKHRYLALLREQTEDTVFKEPSAIYSCILLKHFTDCGIKSIDALETAIYLFITFGGKPGKSQKFKGIRFKGRRHKKINR